MTDPKDHAIAVHALKLCNDVLDAWTDGPLRQEGGLLACALAAELMPRVLSVFLSKHMDPAMVESLREAAQDMAECCGLDTRWEEVKPS